ncbi:MAG: hemolysin III family protein [Spirochaetaceae bacterium]|jgi:hemolysin III|nr:hemolysin III family protein [Spirochaetaceae bacterium]
MNTASLKSIDELDHSLEEKLNSMTHSIGAGLSIAGLVFLLAMTHMRNGTVWQYVAFSIYGSFQVLLYLTSSLTHLFTDHPKLNTVFRAMDQVSIYLLIAGTYTPIALITLRGPWGWLIFGLAWGFALFGIILKTFFTKGVHILSDLLYLPMGWLIFIVLKPLRELAPQGLLIWITIGGACYSLGIIFYLLKKMPYSHVIWHIFVLGGGMGFYMGFVRHLI